MALQYMHFWEFGETGYRVLGGSSIGKTGLYRLDAFFQWLAGGSSQ